MKRLRYTTQCIKCNWISDWYHQDDDAISEKCVRCGNSTVRVNSKGESIPLEGFPSYRLQGDLIVNLETNTSVKIRRDECGYYFVIPRGKRKEYQRVYHFRLNNGEMIIAWRPLKEFPGYLINDNKDIKKATSNRCLTRLKDSHGEYVIIGKGSTRCKKYYV